MEGMRIYWSEPVTEAAEPFVIGMIVGIFMILVGYFTAHTFKKAKWIAITGVILELGCFFFGMFFFRVPAGYEHSVWIDTEIISEAELEEKYEIVADFGEGYYVIKEGLDGEE